MWSLISFPSSVHYVFFWGFYRCHYFAFECENLLIRRIFKKLKPAQNFVIFRNNLNDNDKKTLRPFFLNTCTSEMFNLISLYTQNALIVLCVAYYFSYPLRIRQHTHTHMIYVFINFASSRSLFVKSFFFFTFSNASCVHPPRCHMIEFFHTHLSTVSLEKKKETCLF